MHAVSVVSEQRLRHKCHHFVILLRDIFGDVFVVHHVVRHLLEGSKAKIDFGLSGSTHLVVLFLDRNTRFLQFQAHFAADVLHCVGRRNREISFFVPDLVTKVRKLFPGRIPVPFDAIDAMEGGVGRIIITDIVEDEKLGFGTEERSISDTECSSGMPLLFPQLRAGHDRRVRG